MKNIIKIKMRLTLALVISIIFSSCEESDNTFNIDEANKEPVVVADKAETNFESTADFLTVTFKNTTPEIEKFEYEWEFGDNGKSKEVNPVHTYEKAGKYVVMLTAQFQETTEILKEIEVVVVAPIQPKASFSAEVDAKEVTFKSLSSDASSFEWDFGDGNTSTEENPTHIYATVGDFEVTLKVKGQADLEDNTTKTVTTTAGFIAKIINGTIEEDNLVDKQLNNDPWSMKKDDPRGGGKNSALNDWIKSQIPVGGKNNTDPGISGSKNSGANGLKLDTDARRVYQEIAVKSGRTYTITYFYRTDSSDTTMDYMNIYVFDDTISDETNLSTNLASKNYTGTNKKYTESSITFTASSDKVLFYAKRDNGISAYIDDISIEDVTP